jgi:hypothetical protein
VTSIERRSCPRFSAAGATLAWVDPAEPRRRGAECAVQDLSRGGVRFFTPGPAPPGTHLDLQLQLPDAPDALKLRGHVVWTRLSSGQFHEVGVEFAPYGEAPGANPPGALERLAALEAGARD